MADWEKIKAEYLTTEISIRDLAQKHSVHYTTIAKKASKEDWQTQRQQQANRTLTKMLTADTKKKVDRASRLMTVADKLLKKEEQAEAWDELEKSVLASVADDVIVGIKGRQADIIIVNTCAFTDDAKNEAIDEILSAVEHKRSIASSPASLVLP